jgi:hypothetical protein
MNCEMKDEKEILGQAGARRVCPFIQELSEDCFCLEMNSLNIESLIYYCGGKFEQCRIYKKTVLQDTK